MIRLTASVVLCVAIACTEAGPLTAQQPTVPTLGSEVSLTTPSKSATLLSIALETSTDPPPLVQPIATGVFIGALSYLGARLLTDAVTSDYDVAYWAGMVGWSVGLPMGVHFGNDRRGRLILGAGTSTAIGIGGVVLARGLREVNTPDFPIHWAVPVVQIGVSVAIERGTGPRQPPSRSREARLHHNHGGPGRWHQQSDIR